MSRSHEAALALALAAFLPSCGGPRLEDRQARTARRDVLEEFSFPRGASYVSVPVRLGGEGFLFLVATSATLTVFDESFTERLGSPIGVMQGISWNRTLRSQVFSPPDAYVGRLRLPSEIVVTTLDLGQMSSVVGRELSGMLGIGFFAGYVLQLDFSAGRVRLMRSSNTSRPEWGSELQLTCDKMLLPRVKVSVSGVEMYCIIDTASPGPLFLSDSVFDQLAAKHGVPVVDTMILTASGWSQAKMGRFPALRVGPFEHRNVIAVRGGPPAVGTRLLSQYLVTLDFPQGRMFLKKRETAFPPDEADMSGCYLARVAGRTFVQAVGEGSPAYEAGIRPGDRVLSLGTRPVADFEMWEILRLLASGDGNPVRMTVERGKKTIRAEFLLKRRL